MKFPKTVIILMLVIFIVSSFAAGEISVQDKVQMQGQIMLLSASINADQIILIEDIISPNANKTLKSEIENSLLGKSIKFNQSINSFEELENNYVLVKGRFSASSENFNSEGFSNKFIFEKYEGEWLLIDTNFHKNLSGENVWKYVLGIFAIVLPILFIIILPIWLALMALWVWILLDILKRDFEDKILWVLIIIFAGLIGVIIYYFVKRPELEKKDKKI